MVLVLRRVGLDLYKVVPALHKEVVLHREVDLHKVVVLHKVELVQIHQAVVAALQEEGLLHPSLLKHVIKA